MGIGIWKLLRISDFELRIFGRRYHTKMGPKAWALDVRAQLSEPSGRLVVAVAKQVVRLVAGHKIEMLIGIEDHAVDVADVFPIELLPQGGHAIGIDGYRFRLQSTDQSGGIGRIGVEEEPSPAQGGLRRMNQRESAGNEIRVA